MKKLSMLTFLMCFQGMFSQLNVDYRPEIQPTRNMQYFSPKGEELYVGDCIPFSHNDTYYLYWLLDSKHHSELGGLGGHQWVVSTTKDLKEWKHYPVVLGIDEEWEKSICTGSVVYKDNKFYAFYATRMLIDGKVNEQLSYAISDDGIHFEKQEPNPFYSSAPGYSKRDFRDPKAFLDKDGNFNLFVSSKENASTLPNLDGAMVHMVSQNLKDWEIKEPVLTGQGSVPECPDYFKWKDWYYLIYGDNGHTNYLKSKSPYGPWEEPNFQALLEEWSNVAKTAEFKGNRRIVAAWIPSRRENKDNTSEIFGGNAIFRELTQLSNGDLSTKFPLEMIPDTGTQLNLDFINDRTVSMVAADAFTIDSPNGIGASHLENIPSNCRITFEIEPHGSNEEFALLLRTGKDGAGGYKLSFSANNQTVGLHDAKIYSVEGLDKKIKIDLVMKDGIIDVDIDNRRCIINRLLEQKGNDLWFTAKHGKVSITNLKIAPTVE